MQHVVLRIVIVQEKNYVMMVFVEKYFVHKESVHVVIITMIVLQTKNV